MQQANENIRTTISRFRLRQWEVAEAVGISDSRLSVWLRTPLRDDRKKRVLDAIDKLTKQPIAYPDRRHKKAAPVHGGGRKDYI